jgi:probable O-glycosylation ligase (exosortase A-associated)
MVMFLAMLVMLPMAIKNSFISFLLWGYTTVLTPANYLYGFMQSVRYNFIFAIIALGLLFLGKVKKQDGKVSLSVTYWLLVGFFIHASLSTLFALSPNPTVPLRYELVIKGLAFTFAIPFFVKNRTDIHAMLAMLALGLGFHGVVEGLKFVASGGSHNVGGIPNSSLTDNNLFALGMVMVLPIWLYFNGALANKHAKLLSLAAALLTIFSIIATNSRGGFLAMSVLGLWYFIASRRKGFALMAVLAGVVIVFAVAPESWFSRVSSIETASEDSSFMSRVAAWQISSAIAIGNPVFGGGFAAIQNGWIWEKYKLMPSFFSVDVSPYHPIAAHSIYFQVLGDLGFVGLILFFALLLAVDLNRRSIRNKIKKHSRPDLVWAIDMADTMYLSLVAFMVGGAGVSLAYYEVVYILICLMSVLNTIVDKNIMEQQTTSEQNAGFVQDGSSLITKASSH